MMKEKNILNNEEGILQDFRQQKERDKYFKLRNILNCIYIFLVILTIALYFIYPLPDGIIPFFTSCLIAILVKATEVFIRITSKKRQK